MKTAQKEKWNNFKERHPKIKKVADKISQLFEKYPNLRQLILFTLFSIVCFVIEYASYTILSFAIPNRDPIKWFIFDFTTTASKGVAGFVAFLVSNVLAQASTFLINRKATFKATNNIIWAGSIYAVCVCGIIILNTWLGSVIPPLVSASLKSYSPLSHEVLDTISGFTGKMIGSFCSFVISFILGKLLSLNFPKRKGKAEAVEPTDTTPSLDSTPSENVGEE